jgi:hypothetical protein
MERSRIIALIVAALYLTGLTYFLATDVIGQDISEDEKIDAAETTLAVIVWLIVCLAFIFWGDEIGQWKGFYVGLRYIDQASPGIAVAIIGWILLLTPGIIFLVTQIRKNI